MTKRSILISGANQGLGFEAAVQLLAKPNVLLFLGSRKLEAGQQALEKITVDESSRGVAVQLDITDQTSIDAVAKKVAEVLKEESLTALDALVNNAAQGFGTFEEVFPVNVYGTSNLTDAIRPLLSPEGSIVNVSSGAASMMAYSADKAASFVMPVYGSSKAALNSLTVQWAKIERDKGSKIRVIAICPGYNATNLNKFGAIHPGAGDAKDGCKIIVDAAMEVGGPSGVYYNKSGTIPW